MMKLAKEETLVSPLPARGVRGRVASPTGPWLLAALGRALPVNGALGMAASVGVGRPSRRPRRRAQDHEKIRTREAIENLQLIFGKE